MILFHRLRLMLAVVASAAAVLASGNAGAVEWLEALPMIGKGQDEARPAEAASGTTVQAPRRSKQAVVRILDKQTNRMHQVTLAVGQAQTVGSLTVGIQACLFDYRRTPRLDVAWLDIVDGNLPDRNFSGWMYSLYPAAATLEHPRYDVRVVGCVLPDGVGRMVPSANVSVTTPVASDYAGAGDDEAPSAAAPAPEHESKGADVTAPAGEPASPAAEANAPADEPVARPEAPSSGASPDDPYYVPGLDEDSAPRGDKGAAVPVSPEPMTGGIDQVIDRHELQRMMDMGGQQ